ncbi:MAG: hypothetical protein ABIF77_00955 [bacterium]
MTHSLEAGRSWMSGTVVANGPLSDGLLRLDLELPLPTTFQPGQFAMLNLPGAQELIFSRPFSILAARDRRVSFLYRVVGRGTRYLAAAEPGSLISFFGPLGNGFPPREGDHPVVLIAGGVGLPPLYAWFEQHGTESDLACFGGRHGAEVPWDLLADRWRVSVDRAAQVPSGRQAYEGLVVDLCRDLLVQRSLPTATLLTCGPLPMLRAVADLAVELGWPCFVSVEEQMGCGYGVCRGCVAPDSAGGNLTVCQDGPVFQAEQLDWSRLGHGEGV